MRGPGGVSEGSYYAAAGGCAAQSKVQEMLANWEKDPAKEAAKKLERDRQEKLRKSNEEKEIQKSLQKLKAKEARLRRGEAIQKEAQRIESERLAIQERENARRERLLRESPSYCREQFTKEQARVKAQAEEKARREAEEKARREDEAKAQAAKKANQAKDIPSQWLLFATSLLQQNDQKTNQQAKLPEKTDDKKENSLPNWMALVSGLLNQQGEEKKKPELPPQKDPPPIDIPKPIGGQKIAPATTAPSNPITQGPKTRASEYYSHSFDIYRLQEKFDRDNNISYNSIKNTKTYFDQRVAKWDAELKDIGLITAPPRRPNEQRLMGFEGYIKYLDSNIKQLQTQELTQKELQSGKNPSVNQDQLKTLIAFHYLEKAKVLYSSGKLHLDGIEGGYFKKESVFDKVPEKYRSSLFNNKFKISQNSYTLPNLEKEPTPEVPQFSSQLNKPPAMSARAKIAMINALYATKEAFEDEARFIQNEMGGRRVLEGVKAVGSGIRRVGDLVDHSANDFADAMVQTGVRAKPNTSHVPQNNFIAKQSDLIYQASGSDIREHDSRLREEKDQDSKLRRDTQPSALAINLSQRREERVLAMQSQAGGKNFYGPYNATHGGR